MMQLASPRNARTMPLFDGPNLDATMSDRPSPLKSTSPARLCPKKAPAISDSKLQVGVVKMPVAEPENRETLPSVDCPFEYSEAPTSTSPNPSPLVSPARDKLLPKR